MALRTTFSGSSTPPLPGVDFLNEYAARLDTLFDASALPLITIGGTANAVTAVLDPPLATAGVFVDGMKFTLTWGAANTAAMTLAINGGSPIAVLDATGTGLAANAVASGLRSMVEYIGGSFRILGGSSGGNVTPRYFYQFTASGTWTKPAGLDDETRVVIEAWGGGGGGGGSSRSGGGGGGGYARREIALGLLPSSVSVTIGAGGAVDAAGGSTTFGSLLTGRPGGRGGPANDNGGGGGGGELAQGANGAAGPGAGGAVGGGDGGATGVSASVGGNAKTLWGGGGGAAGDNSGDGGDGGSGVYGGGGGGGGGITGGSAGGTSMYGGLGGADSVAGTARGGGGGRNAPGGRGEVRVWI